MWDLIGNPEDRFSQNEDHMSAGLAHTNTAATETKKRYKIQEILYY